MAIKSSTIRSLLLAFALMLGVSTHTQALDEVEPNNLCSEAQDLGALILPATLTGSLDSPPEIPDIDFFHFEAVPGEQILVDLEGSTTGAGTLFNPLLGLFDSNCTQLAVNDDSVGLNSRLSFTVPDEGQFVLAATACCDFGFTGLGNETGSYRLSLSQLQTIDSIGGRLVNAVTSEPLPGTDFPFASLYLFYCYSDDCSVSQYMNFLQTGGDGEFVFTSDFAGNPLLVGSYQIQAYAIGFEYFTGEPFAVVDREVRDLGNVGLVPLRFIGSVSGRLVDAIDGSPVPGNIPPFSSVVLERCEDFGCFGAAFSNPDESGEFRIDGPVWNLPPGSYRLLAHAEGYRFSASAPFEVDEFEDVAVGDLPITPLPIQFGAVHPCEIPAGGGQCDYGIDLRNRGPGRFKGEAWSTVEVFAPPFNRTTRFQVGNVGTTNPMPQRLNLKQGQRETLSFQLAVPSQLPDGSLVCGSITVGREPAPQFINLGDQFIFCSVKQPNGLEALSGKEGRKRLRELRNQQSAPKPPRLR